MGVVGVPSWVNTPKSTTFGEFKYFEQKLDSKTNIVSYIKGKKLTYTLSNPFEGDKTEICYGSEMPTAGQKSAGIACVLKAVGAKSCAEVDFKKCSDDASVKPATAPD